MPTKILLVEGGHSFQQTLTRTPAGEQIETVRTGDGNAALCLLNETSPDVLIADIELQDKSGYELCQYVREEPEFHSLPVVLVDNHFDAFNQSAALSVGADVYLSKPFEPDELMRIVRELLDGKEEAFDEESATPDSSATDQPLPLTESYSLAQPGASHSAEGISTARQSTRQSTYSHPVTTGSPETVEPRSRKGSRSVLWIVLAGAILAAVGLAVLDRKDMPIAPVTSEELSASERAKEDPGAIAGQGFAAASRREGLTDVHAAEAFTPEGKDVPEGQAADATQKGEGVHDAQVADAVQTGPPVKSMGVMGKPNAETKPQTRRQDSPSVAIVKGSQPAGDNQADTPMSRPRSVRPARSNTVGSHLRRSGAEMKEAGKHLGSGAKHFGESGGKAAEWAGKKVGRGVKQVGRAFKKIF